MTRTLIRILVVICVMGLVAAAFGQYSGRRRVRPGTGPVDRGNVPTWPVDENFPTDLFTFARVRYTSSERERSSFAWYTDYPDADLNLSYRLQQVTALKVHPEPVVIEITDPKLSDHPWLFISGAGNIDLSEEETRALRAYLLNGGFLMIDDFWGQAEWDGVYRALKRVFPNREPEDVPRQHQIFHCVYDLPDTLSLQTSNVRAATSNRDTGITWEDSHEGGNTRDVHFRAIYDDKKRMMVFLCHNTDNGDGWEEESTDPWFFVTFSEKKNYPLAINILYYVMTH